VTKWSIDLARMRDPSWLHWMKTISLLAAYLAGVRPAIWSAIVLCAVAAAWYFGRLRALRPFPVQIRLGYGVLLLLGLVPGLFWIHWVQLIGTIAMVTVGYCLMERLLSLLPWNRGMSFTSSLAVRTLFRAPGGGGLFVMRQSPAAGIVAPCSMA